MSAQFDFSVETVHTIISEELTMRKERRCHDSREMVELIISDPAVLDALVTCDNSWI